MNKQGFTLVELMVVVTVLAILGTIGFISYSNYLTGVRDTNRISQLEAIGNGLDVHGTKYTLPLPDDYVTIKSNGTVIGYQGYAGINVLETIAFAKGGKDPKDKTYFSYYLTANRKYHQLMAFMEEKGSLQTNSLPNILSTAYAATDYSNRFPSVSGKKLGILTGTGSDLNTPIQEITATEFDIATTNTEYVANFSDNVSITGTGGTLMGMLQKGSCKRIQEMGNSVGDGIYTINPTGASKFKVYCDMTTDGGGWTYATMLADGTTRNLFDTGNTTKITSLTQNISTKGTLSNIWLDNNNKDIMLYCFTNATSATSKYNDPFIIYDYLKSDINNLEKYVKANTTFASVNLQAKWKTFEYTLGLTYASASSSQSMYITNSTATRLFGLEASRRFYQSNTSVDDSPYDNAISISNVYFDNTDNYCLSAIR